jgi:hypothetical protein
MTDLVNIVWGYGPMALAFVAVALAVEAYRAALAAQVHVYELEALISRHRRADANERTRLTPPEVG